ncbi:pif-1 [Agrotis segetum granulovirus]|uniref:Pif-1 n=1 Tax=Agrotis segetum granulosis virus TaxID=10464 RepID=A0A023MHF1_GVAS|nr:pif-1 [Agrotis segetum granulovirus]AHN92116.1 pif-1 [Agrotis segetum granulovirus]AKN63351.1 pif-1 [Agrotis segetum granulovirus]
MQLGLGLSILFVIVICLIAYHGANMTMFRRINNKRKYLEFYDNSSVPRIEPPEEIYIPPNPLECHTPPLTKCTSNADCQLCQETRALCQEFNEQITLEFGEDESIIIEPGEKYCIALNDERARNCNPNTGLWIMRRYSEDTFSLICHCTYPGLVTQLTLYDDCDYPVGCRPHGYIADINASPLRCECDNGYVSDISISMTPYCRQQTIRDKILDPEFFPRPPCPNGMISTDFWAFNNTYLQQTNGVPICIMDPCSFDPISGERTSGYMYEFYDYMEKTQIAYCVCDYEDSLYPVYSPTTMFTGHPFTVDFPNACIKPLRFDRKFFHADVKSFWGRAETACDMDVVIQTELDLISPNYQKICFLRQKKHPHPYGGTDFNPIDERNFIIKFTISAFRQVTHRIPQVDVYQLYTTTENRYFEDYERCFREGVGECMWEMKEECVVRFNWVEAGMACFFTTRREFLLPMRLEAFKIMCYGRPTLYRDGEIQVVHYVNANFDTFADSTTEHFTQRENLRMYVMIATGQTVHHYNDYANAGVVLGTYPHYSAL